MPRPSAARWRAAGRSAGDMRIAFGDLPGIESIQTLAAIERAKERGVNVELIILNDEDLAAQAIVGGQADVGIGAPYTLIQKVGVPIRMFAQISTLRFFPVVNGEFYKTWKDLDGQEIAVQARGSGTEAVMLLMAKNHGITLRQRQLRAGLRGPPQRAAPGHDQGLDRRCRQPPRARSRSAGQVHRPAGRESRAPPTRRLFATADYLKNNAADVDILVEELIKTGARDHRQSRRRGGIPQQVQAAARPRRRSRCRDRRLLQGDRRGRQPAAQRRRRRCGGRRLRLLHAWPARSKAIPPRSRSRISGTSRALDRALAKLGKK